MISVIIPTYLPQRYIEECLSSIEHQTIDHNLYEVIVILNGPRMPYNIFKIYYIHILLNINYFILK